MGMAAELRSYRLRSTVVEGMGHDLPSAVWPQLLDRISALIAKAEDNR